MELQRVRVTPVLLVLCLLVFIAMVATGTSAFNPSVESLIRWGASFGPRTLNGEWWRLLSAAFVHVGVLHLLLNGFCLFQLGTIAEALLGSRRFVAVYLLSALGGSLLGLGIHPMTVSAGASGAIFGVAGALFALYRRNVGGTFPSLQKSLRSIVPFILYNLMFGLQPGIDNAAHVGGLVTGLLLGAVLPLPVAPGVDPDDRRATVVIGGMTVLLGAAWAAVVRIQAPVVAFDAGARLIDEGKPAAALAIFRTAVLERPGFAPAHYGLGLALMRLDSAQQALGPLREAVHLDSTNPRYVDELGIAYYHLEQWDSAIVFFTRASQLDSNSWRAAFNGGLALMNAGRPAPAIERFRRAMALAPDSARFRRFFGRACLAADSVRAVIPVFENVVKRFPHDAIAHFYLGAASARLGNITRARTELQAVVSTTDTSTDVQRFLPDARYMLDHLDALPRAPSPSDRHSAPR